MKVSYIENPFIFKGKDLVLALGFFDGFHLAHQKIIKKAVEVANEQGLKSAILTFDTNILDYINDKKHYHLMSVDDKITMSQSLGIDELYVIEINNDFINMSKEEFFNLFLFHQKYLICGFDYSFGQYGQGNIQYLKSKVSEKLIVVDEMKINAVKIGTLQIKEQLSLGNVELVSLELGRPYAVKGHIYLRNKKWALSSQNYFLPKNGSYLLNIKGESVDLDFEGKVKKIRDMSGLTFVSNDEAFNRLVFVKKKVYSISFIKASNNTI